MSQVSSAKDQLALYVHWPFCVSKCPYCDFNSHVRAEIDQDAWRKLLLADLAHEAEATPGRRLGSIFFGGGTPSLMPPSTVAAVIAAAERHWGFAPEVEVTLEANPSSVETARFADLATAGVNRVSLGLQALDDEALRFLGRAHDAREGLNALLVAQQCFARVSFDLIYARPDQAEAAWCAELGRAIGYGTEHLSLYQLTIEPGTRFAALAARGALAEIDPDRAAALFEMTREITAAAGLSAYEVSNHARPGAESRHNLTYWRYRDYVGVGPGAHGRRDGSAIARHRKPETWARQVASVGHGLIEDQALAPRDRAREALIMGLRLREGVDTIEIAASAGVDEVLVPRKIAELQAAGLVAADGSRLRVSDAGMLLLDRVLAEIVL